MATFTASPTLWHQLLEAFIRSAAARNDVPADPEAIRRAERQVIHETLRAHPEAFSSEYDLRDWLLARNGHS